ncbi:MAG: inorganic phosphate transporter family protein [Candidatus Omnitrophica bacterium]|nr:inorganic phosphate transporter family protein [Candidatus Omnitrophota bacterium]MBU1923284.1 inorganic phosphate transporter family protein [Candidatus Omnitrophota bacterium]
MEFSFLIGFVLLMGAAVGWSIGANDAANSLGAAVGCKVLTMRQAIVLIVVFGFLGAFLQGGHVTKTIGKGIVSLNELDKDLSLYLALVASFAACAWVILATYWKMPISTSHSIVGAVAGAGLAVHAPIKWLVLRDIFACWIFTPLGAAVLGYLFFKLLQNSLYRIIPRRYLKPVITLFIILSGCYVAFTWGANDVANAVGVISGSGVMSAKMSVVFGGLAIVIGITTWGYKVIETVGTEVTRLLPIMALSAQLASAVNVHVYTLIGIPVSTSHSIVGAIVGVGMVRGIRVLNFRIVKDMVICWMATPFISGLISYISLWTIKLFVKI